MTRSPTPPPSQPVVSTAAKRKGELSALPPPHPAAEGSSHFHLPRRQILHLLAATAYATLAPTAPAETPQPILDAHVHLFDPTRPGGIPWPKPGDLIFQPALPPRLQTLAAPLGVVGAIAVEASPLRSDNDWLLDQAIRHPFIVGFIGDLVPSDPTFAADLDRLHSSPLFLGIRLGNLWDRDLAQDLADPHRRPLTLAALRQLARANLVLEIANPTPALLAATLDLAQAIPTLRIVIDHLPHLQPPTEATALQAYTRTLHALAQSPQVAVKLSEILNPPDLPAPQPSPSQVKAHLDQLWTLFGPTRLLFGSDWPNSDHVAPYPTTLATVRNYLRSRHPAAAHQVLFSNSRRIYRWQPRSPAQHV